MTSCRADLTPVISTRLSARVYEGTNAQVHARHNTIHSTRTYAVHEPTHLGDESPSWFEDFPDAREHPEGVAFTPMERRVAEDSIEHV